MSSKYDDLSKAELIALLKARDSRDATRFGLVWEQKGIEPDHALNEDFVALDLDAKLSCGTAPWQNLIIEGDNYDALRYLKMVYAGRVKCIFIDPPYNTGNKDFVYNDHYVDKDDLWKHSKWCEFIYQRLLLARDLLSQDGVIFCCINDRNRAKLELLMDKVFPGRSVGAFVWRTRSGANDSKEYFRSIDQEYVLCYANSDFSFAGTAKNKGSYSNPDNDPRGPWYSSDLTQAKTYKQRANTFYPLKHPSTDIWYACDPDNVWRFASETRLKPGQTLRSKTMEQIIREHKVLWPENDRTVCYHSKSEIIEAIIQGTAPRNLRLGNTDEEKTFWDRELDFWVGKTIGYGKPRYKRHWSELKRTEKPFSTWLLPASMKKKEIEELDLEGIEVGTVGGTTEGSSLLQEILGNKDFEYPKPLSLVETLIKQSTDDGDLIVDFFAGSGTTAHAVLNLNNTEDADRRFILVSNTEATDENPTKNLCKDVCANRVRKVIEGYSYTTNRGPKQVDPLPGNFAYLKCQRFAQEQLIELQHEQIWAALQLTHFSQLAPYEEGQPFQSAEQEETLLIYLPTLQLDALTSLQSTLTSQASVTLYSWQPELLRHHLHSPHIQIEGIPEALTRRFGKTLKGGRQS